MNIDGQLVGRLLGFAGGGVGVLVGGAAQAVVVVRRPAPAAIPQAVLRGIVS